MGGTHITEIDGATTNWLHREWKKKCSIFVYQQFSKATQYSNRNYVGWHCWVADIIIG
jgi:hypothetical protein